MSGDLNEFLRQAALRREARKRQTGSSSAPPGGSQSVPPSPRRIPSEAELEVLQPIPVEQRHVTPHIPPAEHLGGNVEKTDQKREAHLREAFGNKPAPLERSQKKKTKSKNTQQTMKTAPSTSQASTQADIGAAFENATASQSGSNSVNSAELLAFLRNPSSLRMAFIASEIFNRKFQ